MLQALFSLMRSTPWAASEVVTVNMKPVVGSNLSYWCKWMVCKLFCRCTCTCTYTCTCCTCTVLVCMEAHVHKIKFPACTCTYALLYELYCICLCFLLCHKHTYRSTLILTTCTCRVSHRRSDAIYCRTCLPSMCITKVVTFSHKL